MRHRSKSIAIARPIGTVFAFLADIENERLWRKEVVAVTKTEDFETGATYAQTLAMPSGRCSCRCANVKVTERLPDRRIAFTTTTGSIRRFGVYELCAIDNGTVVTLHLSVEFDGLQKLMTPLIALATGSRLEQLVELKNVLERSGKL